MVGLCLFYDEGVIEWLLLVLIMLMGGVFYLSSGLDVIFVMAVYVFMVVGYICEDEDDLA